MNLNKIIGIPKRRVVGFIAAALIVCFSSGCITFNTVKSVNHLRSAQDTFNQAAAIENDSRFNPEQEIEFNQSLKSSQGAASAQSGYAAALVILRQMPEEEKKALERENLLSIKLTLEGMILWRLGRYDEALDIIDKIQKEDSDQIYTRDSIIIAALPDLIKIDLAYSEISEALGGNNDEKKKVLNKVVPRLVEMDDSKPVREWSAVQHMKAVRKKLNEGHPMHIYLIQAQLAAYRNYKVAFTSINDREHDFVPENNIYKKEAIDNLKDLEILLSKIEDSQNAKKIKDFWGRRCNLKIN